MKVITMTAWRRPNYFGEVVKSLENTEGIDDYLLLVSLDGGYPERQTEMVAILRESKLDYEVFAHEENLGCAGNTGFILGKGFEKADRVIHAEEDTIFHPDAIRYLEYCLEKYENDERIFSITTFTNPQWNDICLDGDWLEPNLIGIRDRFTCQGWATWKRVWDEVKDGWFGIQFKKTMVVEADGQAKFKGEEFLKHCVKDPKGSWANPMAHYWRKGRFEICPHTSLSNNIGLKDGLHTTDLTWKSQMDSPMFQPDKRIDEFDPFFVDDFLDEMV